MIRRTRDAFGFLTILPVGGGGSTSGAGLVRSAALFPVVGIGIGGVSWGIMEAAGVHLGQSAVAAFVLLWTLLVTGGLHLDGFADTVDGIAGGRTRTRRLEIMRSGSSGPIGIASVVVLLLLKYSLIAGAATSTLWLALILAPALARWSIVVLAMASVPVRREGLGHLFAGRIERIDLVFATLIVALPASAAVYFWGYTYLVPSLVVIISTWGAVVLFQRLLGGVTGDTLGATIELTEVAVLAAFLILG